MAYIVKVFIEVTDTTKKDHRPGHFVKRDEIKAGEFGIPGVNLSDRNQAKRFQKSIVDAVKAIKRASMVYGGQA